MTDPEAEPPRLPRPVAAGALGLGAAVLVVEHLIRGLDYWDYSEGVYALTSRLVLHGHALYGHVVAAQPPALFLAGAGALAIHDSLPWLRLVVGALALLGGLLGARATWRLTRSAAASALTPAMALLAPWALHQHGLLTPEALAAPLLLGAVLLASRERTVPAGAALAALAVFVKWPLALPAVAIVGLSADRRRAAVWALGMVAVESLLSTAAFGADLWEQTVTAQLHSGYRAVHGALGVWGQAGWSLGGLVLAATVAVALRRHLADRALLRLLAGASGALLITVASAAKRGTGLNILVPVEAMLVPLAISSLAVALRGRGRPRVRLPAPAAVAAAAGVLFTLAQSASLLAFPRTRVPFIYASSADGAWGRILADTEVRRIVTAIKRCPVGWTYPGPPYVAFLARRSMPDDQPDQFITTASPTLRPVAARMRAVHPVCPTHLPATPAPGT